MAEKKKLSVAEILAAARKADANDGGGEAAPASPAPEQAAEAAAPAPAEPTEAAAAAPASPPKAVPKPGAAGRPSVAEMLAMARSQKEGGASAPAAPAAAKAPAAKPKPADKPAAAPKAKPAAPAAATVRDTGSILAAARAKDKPGPMTKAEAAAKAAPRQPAAAPKPKIVVPPMPQRPAYLQAASTKTAPKPEADEGRRSFLGLGFWLLGAVSTLWTLLTVKFMFPNVLREPPSKFKVGFPDAFTAGQVQEKFKAQYGIWVVNTEYNGKPQIFALKTVCTHLGCTPNWLEAEQKFKCPCHGSGFYKDGINFEGPAPRPLERYAIRRADDGQIEVDKSRTFQEEMGQWADPASFIPA